MVDASTIKHQIRDSAEFLFKILSDPVSLTSNSLYHSADFGTFALVFQVMHSSRTPVLVACNKQDLTLSAKGAAVIEREMTKEISLLRETHARLLDGTDNEGVADHVFLGKEGKDFEFSDLKAKVNIFVHFNLSWMVGNQCNVYISNFRWCFVRLRVWLAHLMISVEWTDCKRGSLNSSKTDLKLDMTKGFIV